MESAKATGLDEGCIPDLYSSALAWLTAFSRSRRSLSRADLVGARDTRAGFRLRVALHQFLHTFNQCLRIEGRPNFCVVVEIYVNVASFPLRTGLVDDALDIAGLISARPGRGAARNSWPPLAIPSASRSSESADVVCRCPWPRHLDALKFKPDL